MPTDGRQPSIGGMARELGLERCRPLSRDPRFLAALLAAGGGWLLLWLLLPVQPMTLPQVWSWAFFSLVLWQPFWEEVLFRGFLQGQLHKHPWGRQAWQGMTVANLVTSLVFMLGHWLSHPPLWATMVLIPALVFGYFRDRYASVYPAIALHTFYNAGYFLLTGLPR